MRHSVFFEEIFLPKQAARFVTAVWSEKKLTKVGVSTGHLFSKKQESKGWILHVVFRERGISIGKLTQACALSQGKTDKSSQFHQHDYSLLP